MTEDVILKLVHIVRSEYGYTDEYILEKTLDWLNNATEMILEDRYNKNLQLAGILQLHAGVLMGAKDIKIPTWKELNKDTKVDEIKDEELPKWGLGMQ